MSVFHESLSRRSFAKTSLAATIGLTAAAPAIRSAMAQGAATPVGEGTPAEGGMGLPPLPAGATLVAGGLFNPRFLAFGDDGTLYITENGVGGDEPIPSGNGVNEGEAAATPGATPVAAAPEEAPQGPPPSRGYTGQISQVTPDGTQTVIASGLASYSDGVGPVGLALGPNEIYFSVGGVAVEQGFDPIEGENTLNVLDLMTGTVTMIADMGAYEVANNPDGGDVNPNLYMIANKGDGSLLVADAGGNTIYSVNRDSGEITVLAVVPNLTELTGAEPDPQTGPRQSVPTGVTLGDDGTTYVGLLSEMWPEGAPSVLTLNPDGSFDPVGGPLMFNVSITVGPDGNIYASELFGMVPGSDQPGLGRVVRMTLDGTIEPVLENVMMPHGTTFDSEGNLYVAINTLMSGPGMPAGQVIRIDGVAAM